LTLGGGAKSGTVHGETDDSSHNIVKDPVRVRDFRATLLQLLGFGHERFTFRSRGLDQRLTGFEPVGAIKELIAQNHSVMVPGAAVKLILTAIFDRSPSLP
jgi:hypothetical protein